MLLGDMMVNAIDATLQDGKIPLNGVGVSVATYILFDGVIDYLVTGEALANIQIDSTLVSAQVRPWRYLLFDDRLEVGGVDSRNMEGRDATAALHQGNDWFMAR